jgi:hypothetical protein
VEDVDVGPNDVEEVDADWSGIETPPWNHVSPI